MSKRRMLRRRQAALRLVAEGRPVIEVARRLRCARSAIYYWLKHSPDDGRTAAPIGVPTGRPPGRRVAKQEAESVAKQEAESVAKQELELVNKRRLAYEMDFCFSKSPRIRQVASAVWPEGEPLPEEWTPELKQEQLEKRTGKTYEPAVAAEMIRLLKELWKELNTRKR